MPPASPSMFCPRPRPRQALAEQVGADGLRLLAALAAPTAPAWLREIPAVDVLRQVWVQQYHAPDEVGLVRWRELDDLPPAARRLNSPHDPEARYSMKRDTVWTGYKVHLTETCDADTPNLVVHVQTTPATTPDFAVTGEIHQALAAKGVLPATHLVDAGYVDGAHLAASRQDYAIDLIGPAPADHSWQFQAGQGFATADFALDWAAQQACAGRLLYPWRFAGTQATRVPGSGRGRIKRPAQGSGTAVLAPRGSSRMGALARGRPR